MAHRRTPHRRNPSVDQPKYAPVAAGDGHHQPAPAQPTGAGTSTGLAGQISDYDESDTQAYQQPPPAPPPSTRTTQQLNMSVLQRHDPEVAGILSIAPYAVIYEFSPLPEPAWAKTGVEGSLFICQLTPGVMGEDRYAVMVLNRRGLDNFAAPLMEEEDAGVEITDEYVIISFKKAAEQKIYGVFIFSEGPGSSTADTREVNGNLMKTLAALAGASRQTAERDAAEAQAQAHAQAQAQAQLLAQAQALALAQAQTQSQYTNGYLQQNDGPLSANSTLNHSAAPAAAAAAAASRGQHISLQQLFGQQRAEDAAASVSIRNHHLDGSVDSSVVPPIFHQNSYAPHQPQQSDNTISDLFRRAGIGLG